MIRINGRNIAIDSFPDKSMFIKESIDNTAIIDKRAKFQWFYENDSELVALIYLVGHYRAHGVKEISLWMPYIPNARMDRVKAEHDVFTLKYFSGVINSLGFEEVEVLDPHSNVSEGLIDNIRVRNPKKYIEMAIELISKYENDKPSMFYPDEGAGKRYSGLISAPYSFGIKKRDWSTGDILGLDVAVDVESINGKNILIVDDICSKGGTFYHSAKKLKELGAKNIYLYVTHCEDSIEQGQLLTSGLIKHIYTTNSICKVENDMITRFDLNI